jgi:hypothetical protein
MPGKFIKAITATALILSASYAAPAWSAGKSGSGNCPYAKNKVAKRSTPVAPARSVMVVERRKLDVQVLSFGP